MQRLFHLTALSLFLTLAAARQARAQGAVTPPGYGYATDTANRIIEIELDNGTTQVYNGTTVFPANALGFATNIGTQGSVIYSSTTTVGELGIWNRATNQHTDLGNITSSGYTNPYTGGAPADAAFWDGGYGVPAGYYIVDSSRNVYRVDLTATAITQVTKVATIPATGLTSSTLSFGDIAFDPNSGLLYLTDSNNGLYRFNLTSTTTPVSRISSSYYGQLAFGLDGKLYGIGKSTLASGTTGNDFYQINTTTGAITLIASNTDPGQTYRDFAGATPLDIVPEPSGWMLLMLGTCGLFTAARFVTSPADQTAAARIPPTDR